MTAKDYIDEVKLRLPRYNVATKVSDPKILTYVNQARREVQRMTMGLYPERYGKILTIPISVNYADPALLINTTYHVYPVKIYRVPLPDNFLDAATVIVSYVNSTGVTYRNEARRMTKSEMFSVQMHSWNYPSINSPTYAIEYKMVDIVNSAGTGKWLYISGFEINATTDIFTRGYTAELEIYCLTALDDLELSSINKGQIAADQEYVIPVDLEELVILHAIMYCMQNEMPTMDRESIIAYISSQYAILEQNTQIIEEKFVNLLPSREVQ